MPKIVVLNRMHLDEWPSDQVAEVLQSLAGHRDVLGFTREAPGPGWKPQRGYDANITDCFPGNPRGNREQRDAWRVTRLARKADLVLDIHGTRNPAENFPFYGPAGRSSRLVKGTASLLGCEHAVIIGAPHPAGVLHNYVGWDLGPGSSLIEALPGLLAALAKGWMPPARPMAEYQVIDAIQEAAALRAGLQPEYPPFTRLPDRAIRTLGLPVPAYAFSWDANLYSHTGYWGEIAAPYRDHPASRRPTRERAELAHLSVVMVRAAGFLTGRRASWPTCQAEPTDTILRLSATTPSPHTDKPRAQLGGTSDEQGNRRVFDVTGRLRRRPG